jgi:hypothetical protein
MLKVNTDPDCPGADIRKGDNLNAWDTVHQDKGFISVSMTKERHREIFGPKCKCGGDCRCNAQG